MGRSYDFVDDHYEIHVREDDGHIRLQLEFKKTPPAPVPPERRAGTGQRVIVPANEHMRRKGIHGGDEATVISQGDGMYEVSSRTEPGAWHVVRLIEDGTVACTCAAFTLGRHLCRHVKAVRIMEGLPVDAPLRPAENPPQEGALFLPFLSQEEAGVSWSFSLGAEPTD